MSNKTVGLENDIKEKLIQSPSSEETRITDELNKLELKHQNSGLRSPYKNYYQPKYDPSVHDKPIGDLFKSRMTYCDAFLNFARPAF